MLISDELIPLSECSISCSPVKLNIMYTWLHKLYRQWYVLAKGFITLKKCLSVGLDLNYTVEAKYFASFWLWNLNVCLIFYEQIDDSSASISLAQLTKVYIHIFLSNIAK